MRRLWSIKRWFAYNVEDIQDIRAFFLEVLYKFIPRRAGLVVIHTAVQSHSDENDWIFAF